MLGGVDSFAAFHDNQDDKGFVFIDIDRPTITSRSKSFTDCQANEIAIAFFGHRWQDSLSGLSKPERNARLRRLKEAGLSALQIERLTGIGRNIINRA